MTGYVALIRRQRESTNIPYKQFKRRSEAELWAERMYSQMHLDMVMIVEVDPMARIEGEEYNSIFKLERLCKHTNVQSWFDFNSSEVTMVCSECGMTMQSKGDRDGV